MNQKIKLFASLKKEKEQQEKAQQHLEQQKQKQIRMQEKETAKEKRKAEKMERAKRGTGKRLAVSFLLSAIFFSLCLFILKDMSEGEETVTLYVAKTNLPANYQISELSFFTAKEIPVSLIPKEAVSELKNLSGLFTRCSISENQILTANLFTDKEAKGKEFENPVEVSVGTSSIVDMVGGVLRAGDLVNVSTVWTNNYGETVTFPVIEKAYVTRTFTGNGVLVESQDTTQPVTVINLLLEASEEAAFHSALEKGMLRISRVVNP